MVMSKQIVIYMGFKADFLEKIKDDSLINSDIKDKRDCKKIDEEYKQSIISEVFNKKEKCWVTYEEYESVHSILEEFVAKHLVSLKVVDNNIFPGLYPFPTKIDESLYEAYRQDS